MTPFPLFLLLGVIVQAQILPWRCNTLKMSCVGEGSPCSGDWFDDQCIEDYASDWSTCARCADDSLTCHNGKCVKNTQGRGETCSSSQHLWCQSGLSCSGSVCVDPSLTQPTNFAARGETCQQDNDCYNGYCDPFVNKCVNSNVDPTSQENICSTWADCNWEEYCSPQDTTTSPTIPPTCKPVPGGFGSRSGALCKIQNGANPSIQSNPSGACGWTQFCTNAAQDENDDGHTAYTLTTCQSPYSIPEGGMCPPDIQAGQLRVGDNYANGKPISFCATGPCVSSGPNGYHRCSTPDYTYAGTGCRDQSECGRGMVCDCPRVGGGRSRCLLDTTYQNWEQGRTEWFDKLQPWLSCLENNKCTLNDASVGSCGNKHCKGQDQSKPQNKCTLGPFTPEVNVPNYRGYHDTIGAASQMGPSVFVITLLAVLYAALH